jgi:nucleoside 2-deoxyribosyltransferase
MKLYLAGPMTGIKYFNAPAFADAAFRLRLVGFEVFNPAENDIANGIELGKFDGTENLSEHGFSLRDILKQDLTWICDNADGIAVLDDFRRSKGVAAELALAHALGIPVNGFMNWITEIEEKETAA